MSLPPSTEAPITLPPLFWWGLAVILGASGVGWWLAQPLLPALLGVLLLLLVWVRGTASEHNALKSRIEQREQDLQTLQQVQANKNELLATISHELRTPLNVVMGLHPSIQEGVKNDAQAQVLLEQMQVATHDLLQAFQSILDASQPRAKGASSGATMSDAQQQAVQAMTQEPWQFLVVDDNPLNLLVLRMMLEKRFPNAEVVCMNDAYTAVQYLTNMPLPHVLLVDVWMPDMNGYDLSRWVRNHARTELAEVPIVAITGTMRAEDVALRQNCGINDVVYKPLDEHQLCVCLSQLLQEANDRGRA
jgi:PleD family two-component response regulator